MSFAITEESAGIYGFAGGLFAQPYKTLASLKLVNADLIQSLGWFCTNFRGCEIGKQKFTAKDIAGGVNSLLFSGLAVYLFRHVPTTARNQYIFYGALAALTFTPSLSLLSTVLLSKGKPLPSEEDGGGKNGKKEAAIDWPFMGAITLPFAIVYANRAKWIPKANQTTVLYGSLAPILLVTVYNSFTKRSS